MINNPVKNSTKGIYIITGILLTVMSVAVLLNMGSFGLGQDIWYDEVFSLGFAEKSLRDIVELTAMDVHPPLYYFYVKAVVGIGKLIVPDIPVIVVAKFGSLIAGLVLVALILIAVTKRFGILAAGLCCFMTVAMPQVGNYYVEIRMYAPAMLLITSNLLLAIGLICGCAANTGRGWIRYAFMLLTGIMAAYTQYYAAIAIAGIYLAVLAIALVRKNRAIVRHILVVISLSVILFLPWIGIVLKQMSAISGKYWIQPMTLRSLAGCAKFIFMPATVDAKQNILGAGLLLFFAAGVVIFGFAGKHIIKNYDIIILCLAPVTLVVLSGFVLSILGIPIFVYRYMIPALPAIYLAFAIVLSKMAESAKSFYLPVALVLLLTFGCRISIAGFQQEEGKKIDNAAHALESINSIPKDAVVITNFDHVAAVTAYYLRAGANDVYLYDSECDPLINRMFGGSGKRIDKNEMLKLAETGKAMVFLGSFNSREELVEEFGSSGMDFGQVDSFLCERYWINKYELKY